MPIPTAINDLRESELQVSSYPNPFKNTVNFEFYLQKKSNVSLSVFDLSGQELFILNNDNLGVGKQQMVWNGTNSSGIAVPDGIYFVKLKINEEIVTWKIIKN
jgi:flagellar hook assembly protein FlgD